MEIRELNVSEGNYGLKYDHGEGGGLAQLSIGGQTFTLVTTLEDLRWHFAALSAMAQRALALQEPALPPMPKHLAPQVVSGEALASPVPAAGDSRAIMVPRTWADEVDAMSREQQREWALHIVTMDAPMQAGVRERALQILGAS